MNRILLCIIVLSIPNTVVFGVVNKITVALTKVEIDTDPKYLNASVQFTRYSVEPYFTFDMTFILLQKINELTMRVRHFVTLAGIENEFYDVTVDFCTFLKRPNHSILKAVFQEIQKHGPMPTSCPIFPIRAIFSNISLNKIRFPPYMPEARFRLLINGWIGSKQGKVNVYEGRWFGRLRKIIATNE